MTKRTRALLGSLAAAAMISFAPVTASADGYWQCVPFARLMSGIQIFGDARTWWSQAAGKYDTGSTPKIGSVLSFKPTARMNLGHVAFVSQVLTDRVIQVTHANWSIIEGDRGQIEKDVTVVDVSPNGDWEVLGASGGTAFALWRLVNGRPSNPVPVIEKTFGVQATARFFHTSEKILAAARRH